MGVGFCVFVRGFNLALVLAAGAGRDGAPIVAENGMQFLFLERQQIADAADTPRLEHGLGLHADPRQASDLQRGEECRFRPGRDHNETARLAQLARDAGDQLVGGQAE